jgi:hypothetical protein
LNLLPFAGIAFLWFIGALRDRLGGHEDRFFATVFFGSGLLFLGMLFTAAAVIGALLMTFVSWPELPIDSAILHFARAAAYSIVNVYMVKMAGVFMISTSTVAIFTGIAPPWLAILGYALSMVLLFGSHYMRLRQGPHAAHRCTQLQPGVGNHRRGDVPHGAAERTRAQFDYAARGA